jgi:hypothetical protein
MEENIALVRRRNNRTGGFYRSPAFNFGLKLFLGFIIVLIFLTLAQCSVNKPEAPTFTTDFVIPLINRTYAIEEIIDRIDQPGLEIDSSGEIMFSIEEELDTIRIADELNIENVEERYAQTLGEVSIEPASPQPVNIALSQYVSLTLGGIQPTSFDIQAPFEPFENFSWAEISSGQIDIRVINDFGVDLDTVIVQIYDLGFSNIIAIVPLPPPGLPAGAGDTVVISLDGKIVSNQFRLDIHCHTPGGLMLSLDDKTMTAAIAFPDGLQVAAAQASVPAIAKSLSREIEISESNVIHSAVIQSGSAELVIDNKTPLHGTVQIVLSDFRSNGTPYAVSRNINSGAAETIPIDLAGYSFEPFDITRPQAIGVTASAMLESTGLSQVVVHQDDSIAVSVAISDVRLKSLTGIIDSTTASFDSVSTVFEIPKGFDSVQLVNAELVLEIENGFSFPGELDIVISGNQGKRLSLSGSVAAGDNCNPVISTIVNSSLADFLNPVPSEITASGDFLIGDGATLGTITAEDYIVPRVKISSPLELVIGETVFEGDIVSQKIEQDDIDLIADRLMQATFNFTVVNRLPIGVSVEIFFSGDSAAVYSNPELTLGPIEVDAGIIGDDGRVITAVESNNIVSIDSSDAKILEHPILYSGQIITLAGTDGQRVKISGDDYIIARGHIEIQYKFDGEF